MSLPHRWTRAALALALAAVALALAACRRPAPSCRRSSRAICSATRSRRDRRSPPTGRASPTWRPRAGRAQRLGADARQGRRRRSPTTPTAASGSTSGPRTASTCSTCRTSAATRTSTSTRSTWRRKVVRDLTPFQGIRAQGIDRRQGPPERDAGRPEPARPPRLRHVPRRPDHRRDRRSTRENPGDVVGWVDRRRLRRSAARRRVEPDGRQHVLRVRDGQGQAVARAHDLAVRRERRRRRPSPRTARRCTSRPRSAPTRTRAASRSTSPPARSCDDRRQDPKADVGGGDRPPRHQRRPGGRLQLPEDRVDGARPVDQGRLRGAGQGAARRVQRRQPRPRPTRTGSSPSRPTTARWPSTLYDRETKKAEFLFVNQPELAKYKLAKMEPVVIKARDGLDLVGYLTLPVGRARRRTCRSC